MTYEQYRLEFIKVRTLLKIDERNISREQFTLIAHQMSMDVLLYVAENNPPSPSMWNDDWVDAVNCAIIEKVLLE